MIRLRYAKGGIHDAKPASWFINVSRCPSGPARLPSQGDGVYNHAAGHQEVGGPMGSSLRRSR